MLPQSKQTKAILYVTFSLNLYTPNRWAFSHLSNLCTLPPPLLQHSQPKPAWIHFGPHSFCSAFDEGFFSFTGLCTVTLDTHIINTNNRSSANLQCIPYHSPSSLNPFRPTGLLSLAHKCDAPSCHRMFAQAVLFGTFLLPFSASRSIIRNAAQVSFLKEAFSDLPVLSFVPHQMPRDPCSFSSAPSCGKKSSWHLRGCLSPPPDPDLPTESQHSAHCVAHSGDSVKYL